MAKQKPQIFVTVRDRETGEDHKVEVVPGMGATYYVGSDSYAFTVIEVVSATRVKVQEDIVTKWTPFPDCRGEEFERNPEGRIHLISRRKHDWARVGQKSYRGMGYVLGFRGAHRDPSF